MNHNKVNTNQSVLSFASINSDLTNECKVKSFKKKRKIKKPEIKL